MIMVARTGTASMTSRTRRDRLRHRAVSASSWSTMRLTHLSSARVGPTYNGLQSTMNDWGTNGSAPFAEIAEKLTADAAGYIDHASAAIDETRTINS